MGFSEQAYAPNTPLMSALQFTQDRSGCVEL